MRPQRLLKVHRLRPTPLQPTLQNGIIVWTPQALCLHFLWGWQLVISLSIEGALVTLLSSSSSQSLRIPLLILTAINTPLCALPILETCLYANLALTSTRYLFLQVLKTLFYGVVFVLRILWFQGWCISSIEGVRRRGEDGERDLWYSFGRGAEGLLFLSPWTIALAYGIILLQWERTQSSTQDGKSAPDRITVTVTPADEETRLLE